MTVIDAQMRRGNLLGWLAALSLRGGLRTLCDHYLFELVAWCAFFERDTKDNN